MPAITEVNVIITVSAIINIMHRNALTRLLAALVRGRERYATPIAVSFYSLVSYSTSIAAG